MYFSIEQDFPLLKWMHNDFMYVRFAGMRNTETWSKSNKHVDIPKSLTTFMSSLSKNSAIVCLHR